MRGPGGEGGRGGERGREGGREEGDNDCLLLDPETDKV